MNNQTHKTPRSRTPKHRGFTLVEILIVVVILGVLSAIVVPAFAGVVESSKHAAFATELKHLVNSAEYYMQDTGQIIEDGSSGVAPDGFADYIDAADWAKGTPLGGQWDTEHSGLNFAVGLGVHFDAGENPGEEQMQQVDAILDDGDLTTGVFQQGSDANRFYYAIVN